MKSSFVVSPKTDMATSMNLGKLTLNFVSYACKKQNKTLF